MALLHQDADEGHAFLVEFGGEVGVGGVVVGVVVGRGGHSSLSWVVKRCWERLAAKTTEDFSLRFYPGVAGFYPLLLPGGDCVWGLASGEDPRRV